MKNKAFIFTVLALILGFQVNATVWRVNNRTILNKTVDADFTTLQSAINGASANDTLFIEGSPTAYGNGTLAKPLVVIGTGYFLTDNDTTQAYENQSQVGQLTFNAGSEGSVVMGLYSYYQYGETPSAIIGVSILVDSITFRKNRIFTYNSRTAAGSAYAISVASGVQDVYISQNFIVAKRKQLAYESRCIVIGAGAKCVVNNNIMYNTDAYTSLEYGIYTESSTSNEIYINNNVFNGLRNLSYYSTYLNNIQIGGAYTIGTGDYSERNICSDTQFPDVNDNWRSVDMSSVFVNSTSTVDSGYVLKAASPAIGYGVNGGDCGVFSNDTGYPYVLSGMPDIPAIFSVSIDNTAYVMDNDMSVILKAISHNKGK